MRTLKKIIIAFDSFKGSMTARQACSAAADVITREYPDTKAVTIPIADGGEGTVTVISDIFDAKPHLCRTTDPLSKPITAEYRISNDGNTAIIETAAASGLTLIASGSRDAMKASTYGTGLTVRDAIERGCRRIYIGLGGSATTDGGTGFLQALGATFFSSSGDFVNPCGEFLHHISNIDFTALYSLTADVEIIGLYDVAAPLYGADGAAYAFAPQKGATPAQVAILDNGLHSLADVLAQHGFADVATQPGAGAAGGLGSAILTLPKSTLTPGAEEILKLVGFDNSLSDCDTVITGEGCIDRRTLMGKAPSAVLAHARQHHIPVYALAGQVHDRETLLDAGFDDVISISPASMPLSEAMETPTAVENLKAAVEKFLSAKING